MLLIHLTPQALGFRPPVLTPRPNRIFLPFEVSIKALALPNPVNFSEFSFKISCVETGFIPIRDVFSFNLIVSEKIYSPCGKYIVSYFSIASFKACVSSVTPSPLSPTSLALTQVNISGNGCMSVFKIL